MLELNFAEWWPIRGRFGQLWGIGLKYFTRADLNPNDSVLPLEKYDRRGKVLMTVPSSSILKLFLLPEDL